MKTYKITGTVNRNPSEQEKSANNRLSKVKRFQEWFAKISPTALDSTLEDAKWNYLQEKHNL